MTKKKKEKVIVAMSGGVDSSVSALLLKRAGFEAEGIYMKLSGANPQAESAARKAAKQLGIKFRVVNLSRQFKKEIIDYFISSYEKGQTPNPCVRCNQRIKFGELLKAARNLGGDFLATGHYVQSSISNYQLSINDQSAPALVKPPKAIKLSRAKFKDKDQSYFLYTLTQKQLAGVLFPLGDMADKDEVRKIADEAGLPYIKSESQDICFLYCNPPLRRTGGRAIQHNEFLRKHIKLKPGPIMLIEKPEKGAEKLKGKETLNYGRTVSALKSGKEEVKHQGLPLYTIGQRREIRIGGTGPYYAARFDVKKNILYVVKDFDDPILYKDELTAKNVNWISGIIPKMPFKCEAVIRYRHAPVKCTVMKAGLKPGLRKKGNNKTNRSKTLKVKFQKPQRAITPGQSIVFYKGEEVLGGGIIG